MRKNVKVIGVYERDGVTPKQNTDYINYDEQILDRTFTTNLPVTIGASMFMHPNWEGYHKTIQTSTVNSVEKIGKLISVTTRNTVYIIEIL
jgi:hypothetical protein